MTNSINQFVKSISNEVRSNRNPILLGKAGEAASRRVCPYTGLFPFRLKKAQTRSTYERLTKPRFALLSHRFYNLCSDTLFT